MAAALIGISGNFPLSDDWSYAYTARELCRHGTIRFLPWTGASLVFQAAYGAFLCKLFGFSFTILRLSTLVLAAGAAAAFFVLLRRSAVPPVLAAFATLLLALDPLFVNLSFTFMTDVPFAAFALFAALVYARGLAGDDRGHSDRGALLSGALLCTAALLIRQHGIFVAAAASGAALLDARSSTRDRLASALAAGAIPLVAFVAFHVWLFAIHGAPAGVTNKVAEAGGHGVLAVANIAFRGIEYLGLLLCPLALVTAQPVWAEHRRTFLAALVVLGALSVFLWLREGALVFDLPNVMYDFGLGASSLRDTLFLGLEPPTHVGALLSVPLTVVATLGAALLATRWLQALPSRTQPARVFLVLAFVLLFAGSLLHTSFYFDRYLIPVLPFAIAAALGDCRDVQPHAAAWVLLALLGWYAVAGTHDYMAWNRARYRAIAMLEQQGVGPEQIDGGFEYNAWHLAAELKTWPSTAEARVGQPRERKSWWWVVDDRYVVSFHELDGYRIVATFTYPHWLGKAPGRVLMLERDDGRGRGAEKSS
jgi:4-amino-4-deoxy-L-arabinose transferase-like glycosyltransferase